MHSRNHITKGCKDGEFQCETDGVCIVGYKVCNNYNDCSDQSDEKYCDFDTGDYDNPGNAHFFITSFITQNYYFLFMILWQFIINICIKDELTFGLFNGLAQSKLNLEEKKSLFC